MRRKRHNKEDIFIDLTSLLDVVFILLMVVILYAQELSNQASAAADNASSQANLYETQMEAFDEFWMISVDARYDSVDITKRTIRILKQSKNVEEPIATIEISGDNTDEPLAKLKSSLDSYIALCIDSNQDPKKPKPIILSLNENDDHILYRDEKAIQKIFDDLKDSYEDVYIK